MAYVFFSNTCQRLCSKQHLWMFVLSHRLTLRVEILNQTLAIWYLTPFPDPSNNFFQIFEVENFSPKFQILKNTCHETFHKCCKLFSPNLVCSTKLHPLPLIINNSSSSTLFSLFPSPPPMKYTQDQNTLSIFLSQYTKQLPLHFNTHQTQKKRLLSHL